MVQQTVRQNGSGPSHNTTPAQPEATLRRGAQAVALCGLFATTLTAALAWRTLPPVIAVHFDAAGEANGFGPRGDIWLLVALAAFVYALLLGAGRFPPRFHLALALHPASRTLLQSMGADLLACTNAVAMGVFFWITRGMVHVAQGHAGGGLGAWFLPVVLLATAIPLILSFRQSRNQSGTSRK